jgi:hypothetical protein
MLALTVKEHFQALISIMGYSVHARVQVCMTPHARDIEPLIRSSRTHADNDQIPGTKLGLTDYSLGLLQAQITQVTDGFVTVAVPDASCPGLCSQSGQSALPGPTTPHPPPSLELDERVDDPRGVEGATFRHPQNRPAQTTTEKNRIEQNRTEQKRIE